IRALSDCQGQSSRKRRVLADTNSHSRSRPPSSDSWPWGAEMHPAANRPIRAGGRVCAPHGIGIIDFQRQLADLTGEMLRWFTAPPERRTLSKDRLQKLLASFLRYLNQQ